MKMHGLRRFGASLITISLLLSLLNGCGTGSSTAIQKYGYSLDTLITITVYGSEWAYAAEECLQMASYYDDLLSTTKEDSEIYQINHSNGEAVKVSEDTMEVLELALEYSELSEGRFDLAIGSLSQLWNISALAQESDLTEEDYRALIPDTASVEEALSHVNYENVILDRNTCRLADSSSLIDLGGIAKGYIADRMKEYLLKEGVTSAILSLGGNVLTIGSRPDGQDYTIGIQRPFADSGEVIATLKIKDSSVVSSGIYERYYEVDDVIYHHILDTATGYPVKNSLYGVTIITDSSADGDALSTILFTLGLEEGLAYAEALEDTEAIFITDTYEVYYTSGVGDDGIPITLK